MKKYITSVAFLAAFSSFAQDIPPLDTVELPSTVNDLNWKKEKDGLWIELHPNQTVKSFAQYDNGVLHGVMCTYTEKGLIVSQEIYDEGELHGLQRYYDQLGNLQYEKNYNHGVLHGAEREFFSTGYHLKQETHWNNGVKNGVARWYYPRGGVSASYNYVDDKIEGEVVYYYQSGRMKQRTMYVNSERHGLNESFYETGVKKEVGEYYNSEQVGTWYYYNVEGELERTRDFKAKPE